MSTPEPEPELQGAPHVRNLEIRGLWDGEVNGRAEIRISLEVLGTPNTQIQILDTRSPTVLLCNASVQFLSEEWGQNSEPSETPSQNPLFEFFEPIDPDGNGARMNIGGCSGIPNPINEHSFFKAHSEARSTPRVLYHDNEVHCSTENLLIDEYSHGLRPNFAKRDDQTKVLNLGKRSATDAFLIDIASDLEDAPPDRKTSCSYAIHNPDTPDQPPDILERTAQPNINDTMENISQQRPYSSQVDHIKLSLRPELAVGMKQECDAEICLTGAYLVQSPDSSHETIKADSNILQDGERLHPTLITENLCKIKDIAIDNTNTVPTNPIYSNIDQETASNSLSTPSDSGTGPVRELETHLGDNPSIKLTSNSEQEAGSNPDACERNPTEDYEHNPIDTHKSNPRQSSENEPGLNIVDDILFVQHPANVRAGIYRVVVAVSIILLRETPNDWHDLVIPGLPKLKMGESGLILFLIPDKYGVEFRTMNLRRFRMVEDCLFAEFVDKKDLVIPMRSFDQRNYGIVKDFVVDQEIEARPLLNIVSEDKNLIQLGLPVRYHAMCSLKLHDRCFWAERCCFFLDLDGGPEGFFQCRLQPSDTSLQVVYIPSSSSCSTGVSHLQIICSPRDLRMFCITWLANMSFPARNWLPRIYPGSTSSANERGRSQLRATFTRLYANVSTGNQSYQSIKSALEREDETSTGYSEAVDSGDHSEVPEQMFGPQHTNPVIKAISRTLRAVWTPTIDSILIWTESRNNLLILALGIVFAVCGTLGFFLLSNAYSRTLCRPWGAVIETNAGLLDNLRVDGLVPGCEGPISEYNNVTAELFKQTPDDIDGASLFGNDDTSNHISSDQQEATEDPKEAEEQVL
ncbi:hypothetical protein BDV26DRAFT_269334, partial [Aspergillus bertholletiae]